MLEEINNILNESLEKANQYIPLLIMSGSLNVTSGLIIFFPILFKLILNAISFVYKKLFNRKKNVLNIFNTRITSGKRSKYERSINIFYYEVCNFLKDKSKTDIYDLESDSSIHKEDSIIPEFNFKTDTNFIMPDKSIVYINFNRLLIKDEIKSYIKIRTIRKETIDDFIELVKDYNMQSKNGKNQLADFIKSDSIFAGEYKFTKLRTNKTFENVFLKLEQENLFKSSLTKFLSSESIYNELGIPYKKGFLLYGKPGTGKSSTIYAIAKFTDRNIYKLIINESMEVDDIKFQLTKIPEKSIVIIEDIDGIPVFRKRSGNKSSPNNNSSKENNRSESDSESSNKQNNINIDVILEILDGYNYFHGSIIIFTTNHIDTLDEAIIRPGRMDHQIEYTCIDMYQLNNILNFFFKDKLTINDDIKEKLIKSGISSSKLINTFIMPNLDDVNEFNKVIKDFIDIKVDNTFKFEIKLEVTPTRRSNRIKNKSNV